MERGPADLVFALALVHHLAISNNVPINKIAEFFSTISKSLIIEFIPKSDSQVKRLLATREDIFENYDEENFEKELTLTSKVLTLAVILSRPIRTTWEDFNFAT